MLERMAKACCVGGTEPLLRGSVDDRHACVAAAELVGESARAVGRRVVDDEHGTVQARPFEDCKQRLHHRPQVLGLVVGREDDDDAAPGGRRVERGARRRRFRRLPSGALSARRMRPARPIRYARRSWCQAPSEMPVECPSETKREVPPGPGAACIPPSVQSGRNDSATSTVSPFGTGCASRIPAGESTVAATGRTCVPHEAARASRCREDEARRDACCGRARDHSSVARRPGPIAVRGTSTAPHPPRRQRARARPRASRGTRRASGAVLRARAERRRPRRVGRSCRLRPCPRPPSARRARVCRRTTVRGSRRPARARTTAPGTRATAGRACSSSSPRAGAPTAPRSTTRGRSWSTSTPRAHPARGTRR